MKNERPGGLILVQWIDSHGDGSWRDRKRVIGEMQTNTLLCESVGFVVENTDKYLFIAQSWSDDDDLIGGMLQIPHVAIVSTIALDERSAEMKTLSPLARDIPGPSFYEVATERAIANGHS